jgi:D-alanyl-D-alanine carboxypeptidase/D-alanyl-D-alanine-endopeptidase (penicillin-binding protein 4)
MCKFKIVSFSFLLIVYSVFSSAQDADSKLQTSFKDFETDDQLKHAISSLYVINAKTGQVVFEKNAQVGLAPASTQKIITSITAFEILGKDFRYKTEFGIVSKNGAKGLYINPSGDPTLGSWRWASTREENVLRRIMEAAKASGLKTVASVTINARDWDDENIPDGWIWQDIGNYYGAGAGKLNWRENQYDLLLKSGSNIGDSVMVVGTEPDSYSMTPESKLVSAASGSGDNAYIYLSAGTARPIVRGTIPINESRFKISGSMVSPEMEFGETLVKKLTEKTNKKTIAALVDETSLDITVQPFHTELSPSLDSIIYWFNKKSINLYGEALIKTIGHKQEGRGTTRAGVSVVREFWKEKGIDNGELNIRDGSGLSPLNRVTTHVQVELLKYATTRDWYPAFYEALPEYNGMKMKSGTINGAKGFCGYHKARDGTEYIFSFLVNNYNGSASSLVTKMYKVLDNLK